MAIFLHLAEYFILVTLGLIALGIQVWALSDVLRTPSAYFERVYKRTKTFWGALTGAATFFGFIYIVGPIMTIGPIETLWVPPMGFNMLINLAGVTAAGVYLADVRPALAEVRGRGNQNRNSSW